MSLFAQGAAASNADEMARRNDDFSVVDDAHALFAVVDGVSSSDRAAESALLAARTLAQAVRRGVARAANLLLDGDPEPMQHLVKRALTSANARLFKAFGAGPEGDALTASGTLMVAVGGIAVIGHVGHTRGWLFRDGDLTRLTRDHTVASALARDGALDERDVDDHPLAHTLTRVLGGSEQVLVDIETVQLAHGDRLLLTTNGIHDRLSAGALATVLRSASSDRFAAARRLVGAARQVEEPNAMVSGPLDAATAVVVDIEAGELSEGIDPFAPTELAVDVTPDGPG